MPDFRILKREIDDKYFFFRRETDGSSTIGASGGYKSADVIAHFKMQLDNKLCKGLKPTRMDEVGGRAKSIKVTVLHEMNDCHRGRPTGKPAAHRPEC